MSGVERFREALELECKMAAALTEDEYWDFTELRRANGRESSYELGVQFALKTLAVLPVDIEKLAKRAKEWETLAREAIAEFEDARGYASSYFAQKWGYDKTSADFQRRLESLTAISLLENQHE